MPTHINDTIVVELSLESLWTSGKSVNVGE